MLCPLLLLISLDGFMWNYLDHFGTKNYPNFKNFFKEGVNADHLKNLFVTKTLPNHHSIVTGLYEESHDIIHNSMYDPFLNDTFELDNVMSKWWDMGAEPIWVTNQKSMQNDICPHKSGVYMWPGSTVKIKGMYPTETMNYSEEITLKYKLIKIIESFKKELINLGIVYHFEPDLTGHKYGPYSTEVGNLIKDLDADIGDLMQMVKESHLSDHLNIIITSDHGMTPVSDKKSIILSQIFNVNEYIISGASPMFNVFSNETKILELYLKLKEANITGLEFYLKKDIPAKWHYSKSTRIGDLILVGQPGWNVARYLTDYDLTFKGNHGFDNDYNESWPIFMAWGPFFKKGFSSGALHNVDIYALMCHILNLTPMPNNGSFDRISHILNTQHAKQMPKASRLDSFKSSAVLPIGSLDKMRLIPWLFGFMSIVGVLAFVSLFIFGVYKCSHPIFRKYRSSYLNPATFFTNKTGRGYHTLGKNEDEEGVSGRSPYVPYSDARQSREEKENLLVGNKRGHNDISNSPPPSNSHLPIKHASANLNQNLLNAKRLPNRQKPAHTDFISSHTPIFGNGETEHINVNTNESNLLALNDYHPFAPKIDINNYNTASQNSTKKELSPVNFDVRY